MSKEAFANFGRTEHIADVHKAFAVYAAHTRGHRRAIVEMDEGDRPATDHALANKTWPQAQHLFWNQREVVILPRRIKVAATTVFGCAALAHMTPTRSWQVTRQSYRLRKGGRIDVVGHPPAGAEGHNGKHSERSDETRKALTERYDQMMTTLVTDILVPAEAQGYDVVIKGDFNDPRPLHLVLRAYARDIGAHQLLSRMVTLTHHGPDGMYVIPASGRGVEVLKANTVPLSIEQLHRLHLAEFRFTRNPHTHKESR